jgi:hypothetical protein
MDEREEVSSHNAKKQNTDATGSRMQGKSLARILPALQSRRLLQFVHVLSAGVLVFLSLVMLGSLTGMLWHIELQQQIHWWMKLNPSIFGPTVDWFAWAIAFLLTISPGLMTLARKRTELDALVLLTSLILPLLSVVTMSWSYFVGGTLLVCSGFLAAYTLVSRSATSLGIEPDFAARLVWIEVFALLMVAAAGGVVSILLERSSAVTALIPGDKVVVTDPWSGILTVDLEIFFLARPLLTTVFIALVVVALFVLFREPFQSVVTSLSRRLAGEEYGTQEGSHQASSRSSGNRLRDVLFPYVVLVASVLLGFSMALYPYTVAGFSGVLGSDSWFYLENLRSMGKLGDVISLLPTGRAVFLALLFFIKIATGLSVEWVVRLMPALLACLLATSGFVLVKEGTGRLWIAALAALLAVLSPQTALGTSAGIINNWFALSIANFAFALVLRWIRLRSKLAAAGSLALLLILFGSYAFLWVVVIVELAAILLASIIGSRTVGRREMKHEVTIFGSLLLGSVAILAVVSLLLSFLGPGVGGLDPGDWLVQGWSYVQTVDPKLLGSVSRVFEEAFFSAGNRIDLPFLVLLSILGLIDMRSQTCHFDRMVSASILVPAMLMIIISSSSSAPHALMYLTWRGLYVVPLYVTGALGVESVIRRVGGGKSPWSSRTQLALSGAFAGYVILSSLGFSLRALELSIMVAEG